MDKNLLVNMGVVKTFFNEKRDILEVYLPFVEYALAILNKEYTDIEEVQKIITNKCNIPLPFTTLKTLLKKLIKSKKIQQFDNFSKIKLIYNYNLDNMEYKECFNKVNRDKNKLILGYKIYISNENLTDEAVMELFTSFINCVLECGDVIDDDYKACPVQSKEIVTVSDYFIHIRNCDDVNYQTFKNIYFGFIFHKMTTNSNLSYLINNKKIRRLDIYLDSNFIFRILDLQNHMLNISSYELLELLKQNKFNLSVFSDSIDEVRKVLASIYNKMVSGEYAQTISKDEAETVEGVLGAIYRKQMNLYSFKEYIENLEDEIRLRNITIINSKSVLQTIVTDDEIYYKLLQNKINKFLYNSKKLNENITIEDIKKNNLVFDKYVFTEQVYNSIKYKTKIDSKILKYIESKRRGKKYIFSESVAVFLTCDNVLFNFNFNEHSKQLSIPEVVSEEILTNVLWINNPSCIGDVPIDLSLSIFQSSKYIKYGLLAKFKESIKTYIIKKPEDEKYIGDIYNNQGMFIRLNHLSEDDATDETEMYGIIADYVKINKDYIDEIETKHKNELELVLDTVEKYKKEGTNNLKAKENEIKYIEELSTKKLIQGEEKHFKSLNSIKVKLDRKADFRYKIIVGSLILIYASGFVGILIYTYLNGLDKVRSLITFITFLPTPVCGLFFLFYKKKLKFDKIHDNIQKLFRNKFYKTYDFDIVEFNTLEKKYGVGMQEIASSSVEKETSII